MECVNVHICFPYAFQWRLRLFSYISWPPECFQTSSAFLHPLDGLTKRQRSALQSALNSVGSRDFYPSDTSPAMFLCAEKWKYSEWRRSVYAWLKCNDLYAPRCTGSATLTVLASGEIPTLIGLQGSGELKMYLHLFWPGLIIKVVAYHECTIKAKWLIFHMKYTSFQKNDLPHILHYWNLSSGLRGSGAQSNEPAAGTFVICSFQPQSCLF